MGTSTDAILLYGIPLDEDTVREYDEDRDTESSNPLGCLAFEGNTENGVTLEAHCSNECPEYFATVAGSILRAWRGHPREVGTMTVGEGWDDALRAFCERHGIEWQQPRWWLASWWG